MDNTELEIDFSSIETHDSVTQEEKEAKVLKILLTFEHGLKKLCNKKKDGTINTAGPEAQLILLLSLPTWNPTPLTQHALCRCIRILYGVANYTSVQAFTNKLMEWMQAKEAISHQKKTAVLECINAVVEVQGSKLHSFVQDIVALCLRLMKSNTESSTTRFNSITLLSSLLKHANVSPEESIVKDIFRQSKSFLGHKAAVFRVAGAECLEATVLYCSNVPTLYLSEELPWLLKKFDSASFAVRRALASLISTLVAGSQASSRKILLKKPKKLLGAQGKTSTNDKDSPNAIPSIALMLTSLSSLHNKPNTSEDIRSGIFASYISLFIKLGTSFVESNYVEILRHVAMELSAGPVYNPESPFDALIARQRSNTLLRTVGQKILSEQGQVHAAKSILEFVSEWSRSSSQEDSTQVAGKYAVIAMVDELSFLIADLGDAAYAIQDVVADPLTHLLHHHSYSVQICAAWALRALCLALPVFLPRLIERFLAFLNGNFLDAMPVKKQNMFISLGYSYAIGALIGISGAAPQAAMHRLTSQVFTIANQLLRSEVRLSFMSGDVGVFKSQTSKIQVGWTLLGSLMCLGPNYTRLVLPQLIVLLKTYLAKSSLKMSFVGVPNQMVTLSVAHAREHALQALHLLLMSSSETLISGDVTQRVLPLLTNSLDFYKDTVIFLRDLKEREREAASSNVHKLAECANMIRKRALQCYALIYPTEAFESSFTSLTKMAVELLTTSTKLERSSEAYADEDVVSDWTGWAGSGYAMTSSFHRHNVAIDRWRVDRDSAEDAFHPDHFDLDRQLLTPRFGAREYDPISLFSPPAKRPHLALTSNVISTHDAAVDLFALMFPRLLVRAQISAVERMVHAIQASSEGWRGCTLSHCLFAILGALKTFHPRKVDSEQLNERVAELIVEVTGLGLASDDDHIRRLAADTLGHLCKHCATPFVANQIKILVAQIVNHAEPGVRAGSLLGLASVHRQVGAAGGQLTSVVQVMSSLISDLHTVVHTHALECLATTISATGHVFAPFILDTLYSVFRLFLAETHQPGGDAYARSPASDHLFLRRACGRVLHSIVGALGPEISANKAAKFLCYGLMEQLKHDAEEVVVVEFLQCTHLVIMFDYSHVDLEFLVTFLCARIQSADPQLKRVAANCLYQLVQRDVDHVLRYAGPGLLEQLFQLLDSESDVGEIVVVLNMLLANTPAEDLLPWIAAIQRVLNKHNVDNVGSFARAAPDADDEDGSLQKASQGSNQHQGTSRWRTQLVALQTLRTVVVRLQPAQELIARFGDLVKLAFAAATTPIEAIALEGHAILQDLLTQFSQAQDPQMPGVLLMDQYHAQITAALAPAFLPEASPVVAAAAIEVCATFLTSSTRPLQRISRLMEAALTSCQDSSQPISLAILKAWSAIALSPASQHADLHSILSTNLPKLAQLWLKALCDYAFMRLDPALVSMTDRSESNGALRLVSGLDFTRSSASRDWLRPLYQDHMPSFLMALTHYLEENNPAVLRQFCVHYPEHNATPPRPFWVVFGLCMETLSTHSLSPSSSVSLTRVCLAAVRAMIRIDITGPQFIDPGVFDEVIVVFERFKYTYNLDVIQELIETLNRVVVTYGSNYLFADIPEESTLDTNVLLSNSKSYRILKFYVGVLLGFIPSAAETTQPVERPMASAEMDLAVIRHTAQALVALVLVSPDAYRPNLATISLNLIQNLALAPAFSPISNETIPLFGVLAAVIPSEEVLSPICDRLFSTFLKTRTQQDASSHSVACDCILAYVTILISCPDPLGTKNIKNLVSAIKAVLISDHQKLKEGGLRCLELLAKSFVSDTPALRNLCQRSIQVLVPVVTTNVDKSMSLHPSKRIDILEEVSRLMGILYSEGGKERPSIAKVFIVVLIRATQYEECITTVCSQLSTFASAFPSEFRSTVSVLAPEDRSRLEKALRNTASQAPEHSTKQRPGGSREEFYEDYGSSSDDESFDDSAPAPTIQLKESFF
ncbi:hypothetical protein DSO57_1025822 [Entomophthora muscae]|uniref:Uncharacterized protein n=1 Tax=Entomophthora muscae TaxID=34485 RepID=A0ACC2UBB0_9FUNG|nr:hypothetical protein DSO57_1025822 [Entomophthora muscae]